MIDANRDTPIAWIDPMTVLQRRSLLAGLAMVATTPFVQPARAQVSSLPSNEAVVRELYHTAEAEGLDADRFVSHFANDGYFLDVSSGQRWVGRDVREPVTGLISAYPDMHRELLNIYVADRDVVVVELMLQGTHSGDLFLPSGVLSATGKKFDVPCCDVWRFNEAKVSSFHCYNNLVASLKG